MNLAPFIDHTILKNTTTAADVAKLCREAAQYCFAAVCVPPYYVQEARKNIGSSVVKVATVIGFPFGYHNHQTKWEEARKAIDDGADELDMVMNIAAFKSNDKTSLEDEVNAISQLSSQHKKTLKIIIESGVLNDNEIISCCELYAKFPVQFLKTSTGFGGDGASVHAVQLMRQHLPSSIQIKASGGIKDYEFARALINAGATRLGCSAGIAIIKGEPASGGY